MTQCNEHWGSRWRCPNEAAKRGFPYRGEFFMTGYYSKCEKHREQRRAAAARRRAQSRAATICVTCHQEPALPGGTVGALCRASRRALQVAGWVAVDRRALADMMIQARQPWSRCAISGYTRAALRRIGECLTVDRIRPLQGYVAGNMQLLANTLNSSKGGLYAGLEWKPPPHVIRKLRDRMREAFGRKGRIVA